MADLSASLSEPTEDQAVEALARLLAMQSGLVRDPDSVEEFAKLPPPARHGCRELAQAYAKVVRAADQGGADAP